MGKYEEQGVGGGQRSKSPKVQGFQGPGVPSSKGPKDQDISNSNSITSLTLKKVHLVLNYILILVLQYPEKLFCSFLHLFALIKTN